MIKLTNLTDGRHRSFSDYHEVCHYLRQVERDKALESGETEWVFIRRPYESLSLLYYRSASFKDYLTCKEKEAVKKQLGLIEIVKGNRKNMVQILYTRHLDTEGLKRDWCQDYCVAHGVEVRELVERT